MSQGGIASGGTGPGGLGIQTITGNTGGAISPDGSNNINVTGTTLYTATGNAGTHTITINPLVNAYPVTPYVVGPVGQAGYQTIQSAINAAQASGVNSTVYILPQGSPYTENLTLYSNVELKGSIGQVDNQFVQIIGTHTPPTSGQFTSYGIWYKGTTACFSSNAVGTTTFNFFNVITEITGVGYTFNLPNWNGQINIFDYLQEDTGTNGFLNNASGTTGVVVINSAIGLTAKNATALINGAVEWDNMLIAIKCQYGGTGTYININGGCLFLNTQTFTGSSFSTIVNSSFQTGTNAAIVNNSSGQISLNEVNISSSAVNVIQGTGPVQLGNVDFNTNSGISSTVSATYSRAIGRMTPYIVGTTGTFTTIQAAINAANANGGGVVYIQPGAYTENLTLFSGVDLYGISAVSQNQGVSISITGTHTPPSSGHIGFNSICFISTTNVFFSNAAGSTHIVFLNCESAVQNGYFLNLPNWTGILEIFDNNPSTAGAPFAVNDGGINNTGGATLFMFSAAVGSGTNIMNLSGLVVVGQASINCPVNFKNGSNISVQDMQFVGTVTFSGNATGAFDTCNFYGGASPAITMSSSAAIRISTSTIQSTNNPAITGTGAGVLTIGDITFLNNSNISNSLTTAFVSTLAQVIGGGIPVVTVGGASSNMATNTAYQSNNVLVVSLLLPNVANVGDIIQVFGLGAGGWKITQNAGQKIHINASTTTVGLGGSLASTNQFNSVTLRCAVTNTDFTAVSSVGTITVV